MIIISEGSRNFSERTRYYNELSKHSHRTNGELVTDIDHLTMQRQNPAFPE